MKEKIKRFYEKHKRIINIGAFALGMVGTGFIGYKLSRKTYNEGLNDGMELMDVYANLLGEEALLENPKMKVDEFFKKDTLDRLCEKTNKKILEKI